MPNLLKRIFAQGTVRFLPALILTLNLLFCHPIAHALDSISMGASLISANDWKVTGASISLKDLASHPQKLTLRIERLELPKPFDEIKLVDIECSDFSWQNQELLCKQGKTTIRSRQGLLPVSHFSFFFRKNHSFIELNQIRLADGNFTIAAQETDQQWQLSVNGKDADLQLIKKLLNTGTFDLKAGTANFQLQIAGTHSQINQIKFDAELEKLTVQTPSGQIATEQLAVDTHIEAWREHKLWQWQGQFDIKKGALYIEPVYLEAGSPFIKISMRGAWDELRQRIDINSATYQHSLAMNATGNAVIRFNKGLYLESANVSLQSKDLKTISAIYLQPFFSQTLLDGITLSGEINADFSLIHQSLSTLSASFHSLAIHDDASRIEMQGGAGVINWDKNERFKTPSRLGWQQLQLQKLPFGGANLSFLSNADTIQLLKKATIPFLGGLLEINQFSWQASTEGEPDVSFAASLNNASLTHLSNALDWTPLSGSISGVIPKVRYHNKTLNLDGQLTLNVFDGKVTITNLASSGLFSDFPILRGDMEIDNLDLEQLTGKYSFGSITGKLSGYVRQLTLENWKPVTFYAWLGTPDDDDSSHRISQRAVKNIANIGGGGASDLLSRSFLGLFETFGYDKLGLGCYLYQGVCQLMGITPTPAGYAIITGGGLPRIDVIGYNPRVDWNVLMDRLSRITTSNEVIVN